MTAIKNYFTFVKFSHTIFALPFALIGFFLAIHVTSSPFSVKILILVVTCMVFARNAAMGFNRYIDKDIDKKNPRTLSREMPKGIISSRAALWFVIINCLLFITTTRFINLLVFYLSPVALFIILFYSYTKKFTVLCHFVLGLGLSLVPIGSYLSVTGKFDLLPIIFSLIVLTWTSGFDMIYALQDEHFDKKHGLKSIPALFGSKKTMILSSLVHTLTGLLVLLVAYIGPFTYIFWIGAAFFILLLTYQHVIASHPGKINIAFFTLNGIASVVFAFFAIADLYLQETNI